MRDPYLFKDADVLKKLGDIKNIDLLRKFETDITNLSMIAVYNQNYSIFNIETLQDIHFSIFSNIYEWAGEFRTIQIGKYEDILGGDTVKYAFPKQIKKELNIVMKEVNKLERTENNDKELIFKIERIVSKIWQIHPFREGNTRTCIAFGVLLAKKLGFDVNYCIFKEHANYVRNALVWASQGIYSKHEYLEHIFYDAILGNNLDDKNIFDNLEKKYQKIEGYDIREYKERVHEYVEE